MADEDDEDEDVKTSQDEDAGGMGEDEEGLAPDSNLQNVKEMMTFGQQTTKHRAIILEADIEEDTDDDHGMHAYSPTAHSPVAQSHLAAKHAPEFNRFATMKVKKTRVAGLNLRMRRKVVIEVFESSHRIFSWTSTDILRAVVTSGLPQSHSPSSAVASNPSFPPDALVSPTGDARPKTFHRPISVQHLRPPPSPTAGSSRNLVTGSLTYRDLRQLFVPETHQPIPSVEVRRGCIVLCLPPVTGIVLHDRVYLLVHEDLEIDPLIQALAKLTSSNKNRFTESLDSTEVPSHSDSSTGHSTSSSPADSDSGAFWHWTSAANNRPQSPHSRRTSLDLNLQYLVSSPSNPTKNTSNQGALLSSFKRTNPNIIHRRVSSDLALVRNETPSSKSPAIGKGRYKASTAIWPLLVKGKNAPPVLARPMDSGRNDRYGNRLKEKPKQKRRRQRRIHNLLFEFAAFEILATATFEGLGTEIMWMEDELQSFHLTKAERPTTKDLELLHRIKAPIERLKNRVKHFEKAFDDLLADPEDMKRMELSRYYSEPELYETQRRNEPPNPDLEILLEYFGQEADQCYGRLKQLNQGVENAERLISLRLAISRNRLIRLDLGATLVGVGIALGSCVSGIFGMNLTNGLEESHAAFIITASCVCTVAVLALLAIIVFLSKARL